MERRDFMAGLLCSAALPLGAVAGGAAAQGGGEAINVVERFGFVPDGRTDNYEAFHRWAAHVNRVHGGHYLFPRGTYYVHRHRTTHPQVRDPRYVLNSMIDRADGLTITGYGAKIRLSGAFHRSERRGPDGAMVGRQTGIFMPFEIHRSRRVIIKGFEMDGGVRDTTRDPKVPESYSALIALEGCTDVLLEDLDLHHCPTDGVYLTCSFKDTSVRGPRPGLANRNVTLRNVRSHDNARGGLGIMQVYGLLAEDCAFYNNGQPGRYLPHAPGYGVDVEPDYVKPHVDILTGNIEFRRCEFRSNVSAFLGGWRDRIQGYLRLIDCRSSNEKGGEYHISLGGGEECLVEGGVHDAGIGVIATSWSEQVGANVILRDCEIRTSGLYGISHYWDGNLTRLENVRVVGTHKGPGTHGEMVLFKANPGGGRRNLIRNCEFFIPAARKSREHPYDYEIALYHTDSEGNSFRTDLPAAGGQHFAVGYEGGRARGDRFRGTAPGPQDSIRPGHNSSHDTRLAFTSA